MSNQIGILMMILKELVKGISFEGHLDDREINSITYDSRKVKPGSLFVAISGMQEDGHSYIPEAIENGAVAQTTTKIGSGLLTFTSQSWLISAHYS